MSTVRGDFLNADPVDFTPTVPVLLLHGWTLTADINFHPSTTSARAITQTRRQSVQRIRVQDSYDMTDVLTDVFRQDLKADLATTGIDIPAAFVVLNRDRV